MSSLKGKTTSEIIDIIKDLSESKDMDVMEIIHFLRLNEVQYHSIEFILKRAFQVMSKDSFRAKRKVNRDFAI